MADTKFDLIVVGGGPGGYVAAIRAAQLGMNVACVEREHLGGICLNWGCIPTKALLRSSEIFHHLNHAGDFGLTVGDIGFDATKIVQRSRKVADRLSKGVAHLLKKNKVTVFDGLGKLAGSGKLAVTKDGKEVATLEAKHIILATGARARDLPDIKADGKLIWSYKGGHGARGHARFGAGHRLRRNRHRIRQFLPRHGCRRDRGRSARQDRARRGRKRSRPWRSRPSSLRV